MTGVHGESIDSPSKVHKSLWSGLSCRLIIVASAEIFQHPVLPAPRAPYLSDVISLERDLLTCDFYRGYRWSPGSSTEIELHRRALRARICYNVKKGGRPEVIILQY